MIIGGEGRMNLPYETVDWIDGLQYSHGEEVLKT